MKQDKFIRDSNSGAVLNVDNDSLKAYKLQKAKQKQIQSKLEDIDNIKKDVNDIKNMLSSILEKLNK
jgi:predicted transcriptional regulator